MLSQDTYRGEKADPLSLHLYSYCYNSPINYTDPSGYSPAILVAGFIASAFAYDFKQKIFYGRMYAPQRAFGYNDWYDDRAVDTLKFNIAHKIFYTYYKKKTWRIELWKGSYWGAAGGEIGIYYKKGKFSEKECASKHFIAVNNKNRMKMSFSLKKGNKTLFTKSSKKHWWHTGFKPFTKGSPKNLTMTNIKIKLKGKGKNSMENNFITKGAKKYIKNNSLSFNW